MTRKQKHFYYGIGTMVETDNDDIADLCCTDPASFGQEKMGRTYAEMSELSRQIANAMNDYPELLKLIRKMHRELQGGGLLPETRHKVKEWAKVRV